MAATIPALIPTDPSTSQPSASSRTLFNDGWEFRRRTTAFQELGGSAASGWTPVHVPHDALIGQERNPDAPFGETNAYFPSGSFEYRTTFTTSEQITGKLLFLEFDGVYRDAAVYINNNLAGHRAFGYSRFIVRIDPYLIDGEENEIRVECRTHLDSRWYAGAGIYRDVHLIAKEQVHIVNDSIHVSSTDIDSESAVVEIVLEVENKRSATGTFRVDAGILTAGGETVAADTSPVTLLPGERATVRRRVHVPEPIRWSVDTPHLYEVSVALRDGDATLETETVPLGIRSIQLDPRHGLRINGEQVKLRGACVHLDNGPLGVVSMRAAEERKIARLKAAGFNAIRSSHSPMSTAMLNACDKLGMLVMDEAFDMWTSGKSDWDYAFDFTEWWERDVEAMVLKDRNHPSVIFYSIGNEIPETGSAIGSRLGRMLAEKIRSLDSTRLVTNGINPFVSMLDTIVPQMKARRESAVAAPAAGGDGGVNTMMAGFGQMMGRIQASPEATERTEESFAVLDVAGMNYSDSRYELDRETFPDRIIVGTETWPSGIATNWSLVMSNPRVIGDFTWTGWDYLGETGIGLIRYADDEERPAVSTSFAGGYPDLTAACGDIDIIGQRRTVSYYRETVFGLRSTPYIAVDRPERHGSAIAVSTPWSWTDSVGSWSWPGFEGRPVRVEVYSDAEEVELLLDGESLGRSAVGAENPFRAAFETTYRPGELTAVAFARGAETGRSTLRSAGEDLVLDVTVEETVLRADGTDLAFVEIAVADPQGVVHPTRNRPVTVHVEGAGILQALGSGNPSTAESFTADTGRTFEGRILAVVRPTEVGEISVTITADECEPITVALSVGR